MLMIAVHALWQSNIDYAQPQIYLAIIVVLLVVRLPPVMNGLLKLTEGGGSAPQGAAGGCLSDFSSRYRLAFLSAVCLLTSRPRLSVLWLERQEWADVAG